MTTEIALSQGYVALVDDADAADILAAGPWHVIHYGKKHYAERQTQRPDGTWAHQKMHVYLTGYDLTDHADNDGLNNTRANLRDATHVENCRNRGPNKNNKLQLKGVSFDPVNRRYRAAIHPNRRCIQLGRFDTAEEAARAYDEAARVHFGEFAWLNYP